VTRPGVWRLVLVLVVLDSAPLLRTSSIGVCHQELPS